MFVEATVNEREMGEEAGLDARGNREPPKEIKSKEGFKKLAMEAGIGGRIKNRERQAGGWEEL